MRFLIVGATAAVALVAVLATAHAQDEKGKGGPAAESKGRGSEGSGPREAPRGGESERPKQPSAAPRAQDQGRDGGGKTARPQQPDGDRGKASRQESESRPRATQQQQQERDRPKAAQQQDKDRPKSTQQQQDKDRPKSTEQQDKDRQKTSQPKQDSDRQKSAQPERKDEKSKTAEPGKDQAGDRRVQVSEQNRRGAGQRIREAKVERVNRTRINVNIRVGSNIPRAIHLHTLPIGVYDVAPAYRGYSYVLLEDDTVLIVDARTYVIIDVIPAGSLRADRPGHLSLSDEQMHFVFANVRRDRTADVRVRLALGAEVSRSIDLLTFPETVTARIGDLETYRYVVTDEGTVAIVDPDDYSVVLVITN